MSSKLTGRLWVVAAALMWSSSGLFVKSPIFVDWPESVRGPSLAFWRAFFAALVLLPFVRRPRWQPNLAPLTISFAAMNVMYLTAMTLTTVANAIWLQMTAPAWVFVFSVLLFHEPVVRRDLVPLCFAVLGVGTILAFEIPGEARLGVTLGLGSGVAYASVVVFLSRLRAEDSAWLIALNHAVAALVLLPWVVGCGVWPTPLQLVVLAAFGAFQMAIPYLFLLRGLRAVSSQEAVAIGLIEPILSPLWVFLVGLLFHWGETPAWWTVVGAALILTGLVLRYVLLEFLAKKGVTGDRRAY